ncbi:hypothetical protein ACFE04_004255 [Oxalis oulophora]
MAFWGVEVKPTRPVTHKPDSTKGRLHISQATLGYNVIASKRCSVQCKVGDKCPVFLCSLFPGTSESCQLNLEFDEGDEVVFSVLGPGCVYLTGYFLPSGRSHNFPDESESYGEDIAFSDTERSIRSSEDEYEDSFINDSEPEVASSISSFDSEDKPRKKKTKSDKGRRGHLKKKKRQLKVPESGNESREKNFSSDHAGAKAMEIESESEDKAKRGRLKKKNQLVVVSDDDDISPEKYFSNGHAKSIRIESETESEDKGKCGRLKEKSQLVVSDDDDRSQEKDFSNGHNTSEKSAEIESESESESDSEDRLTISALCKKIEEEKSKVPETKEKNEKESHVSGKTETEVDGNRVKTLNIESATAENKSDDKPTVFSLWKKKEGEKSKKPEAKEKGEKDSHEPSKNEAKVDGSCVKTSNIEPATAENSKPRRVNIENGSVFPKKKEDKRKENKPIKAPTIDEEVNKIDEAANDKVHNENGTVSNKKGEEKTKQEDHIEAPRLDEEAKKIDQNLFKAEEESHKAAKDKNLPDSALPSTDLGPNDNTTSKKKKKEKDLKELSAGEEARENNTKTKGKRKRQTEDGDNKAFVDATDQIASETQSREKKKKKKNKGEINDSDNLVIEDLESGKPEGKVAVSGKKVYINYIGKFMENGQVFDSNVGNSPMKFRLGDESVLKGWNIGIDGMRVGGKRKLIIPPSLGYDSKEVHDEKVPPKSTVVFEIELVKVRK